MKTSRHQHVSRRKRRIERRLRRNLHPGADFAVERGEIFGLLGPNGAGKTSLVSIVAGLRRAEVAIGKNGTVKKELIYRRSGCGRATGDRRRIVALDVALKCRPPSAG